ncbi:MAG: hypothetical protein ACXADU_02385 [Promethearchaeota archaeon]|jgi:hypothetical protein
MDSYDKLPDAEIKPKGDMSRKFLELGITSFKEACEYIHDADYGYNSNYDDKMIFFKENMGSCTSKHAVIAGLAEELDIPLFKYVAIYKFTEEISTGTQKIIEKYNVPYVPMIHCFLVYKALRFDLTEGNCNGKNTTLEHFIQEEKVDPFITTKEEYLLFKRVLKDKILPLKEWEDITERTALKAREEAIILIKKNAKKQKELRKL